MPVWWYSRWGVEVGDGGDGALVTADTGIRARQAVPVVFPEWAVIGGGDGAVIVTGLGCRIFLVEMDPFVPRLQVDE